MYASTAMATEADSGDLFPTLDRVHVSRLTLGHDTKTPSVGFELGMDLKEVEVAAGRARLRYTLYVDSYPAVQRAELVGMVTISSRTISAIGGLEGLDQDRVSEMAMQIYRRNYEALYLLFKSFNLEAPSPWLVQDVHLVDAPRPAGDSDGQAPAP